MPQTPQGQKVPNLNLPSVSGAAASSGYAPTGTGSGRGMVWNRPDERQDLRVPLVTDIPAYQVGSLQEWNDMESKHHHCINVDRVFSHRFGGCTIPPSPFDHSEHYKTNWKKLTDIHDQFFVGVMFAHEDIERDAMLKKKFDQEYKRLSDNAPIAQSDRSQLEDDLLQ